MACTQEDTYESPHIYGADDGASATAVALRARCERLAEVARRAIALRIPAWLEPQMAGVELEGARVCRLREALLALHPSDTEEAK